MIIASNVGSYCGENKTSAREQWNKSEQKNKPASVPDVLSQLWDIKI